MKFSELVTGMRIMTTDGRRSGTVTHVGATTFDVDWDHNYGGPLTHPANDALKAVPAEEVE